MYPGRQYSFPLELSGVPEFTIIQFPVSDRRCCFLDIEVSPQLLLQRAHRTSTSWLTFRTDKVMHDSQLERGPLVGGFYIFITVLYSGPVYLVQHTILPLLLVRGEQGGKKLVNRSFRP